MFLDPIKHVLQVFFSTELSYIQLEMYSLFSCSPKVESFFLKCMFCEPKKY